MPASSLAWTFAGGSRTHHARGRDPRGGQIGCAPSWSSAVNLLRLISRSPPRAWSAAFPIMPPLGLLDSVYLKIYCMIYLDAHSRRLKCSVFSDITAAPGGRTAAILATSER